MSDILFVAGSFDINGGRPSGLAAKMASHMEGVDFHNGGHYDELKELLESVISYKYVFWFANVPNELPKVRHVKDINPKAILISSKRNDDNKYHFKEVVKRAIDAKANLLFEFSKRENIFNIRVIDPLGCIWYDGTDIGLAVKATLNRLSTLSSVVRISTIEDKLEDIKDDVAQKKFINEADKVLSVVSEHSEMFYQILDSTDEYSFRCAKGMPSFKHNGKIYVSARQIEGRHIGINDLIEVYEKDGELCYAGSSKPAVDTPIHFKLYKKLPNIKYILHSHCYINKAPMTATAYPCGAVQEADEILKVIGKDKDKEFYAINELGHGSIVMASSLDKLKAEYYARPIPENIIDTF